MPSKAVSQALVAPSGLLAPPGEGNDTKGHARKDAATDRARPICEIGISAHDEFRTTSTRAEALCTGRKGIRLGAGRPPPQHAHFEGVRFMPPADRSHLVPMPFDDELSLVTLQTSSPDPDLSLLQQSASKEIPRESPASTQRALPDATNITSHANQRALSSSRAPNQADEEVAEPTISRRAHLRALKEAQEHFKAQLAKEIADLRARVSRQTDFQSPSASRRGPPGDFRWTTTQDLVTDVTDPSTGGLEDVQVGAGDAAEERPGWKSRMFPRIGFAKQDQIRHAALDSEQHHAGRPKRTPSPPPSSEAPGTVSETESEGVHSTSDASSPADREVRTAHRVTSRNIPPHRNAASAMHKVSKTNSRMQIPTKGGKAATTSKVVAPENDSVTESDEDDPSVSHLHSRKHHPAKRSQRPKAARTSAKDSAAGRSGKRPSNDAPSSNATIERETASASIRSRFTDRSFSEPNLLSTAGNENASAPSSQPARRAQKKKMVKSGLPIFADCTFLIVGEYGRRVKTFGELASRHGASIVHDFSIASRLIVTHIIGVPNTGEQGSEREIASWARALFPAEAELIRLGTDVRGRPELRGKHFVDVRWMEQCILNCLRKEQLLCAAPYRVL
ncbi:BRCT domain [Ceraceosorus bombacis]|uniref:BRCT domain n=1 Tax=Ceraceosorus bombacis TaxID=401625 RepID=A0A0P1BE83_9BASI|nr:BRCT domain [Ceraceosorus bombacis]